MDITRWLEEQECDLLHMIADWFESKDGKEDIEMCIAEKTVVETSSMRLFVICQECGKKTTLDYTVDIVEQMWEGRKLQSPQVYRMEGEERIEHWKDQARHRCSCGSWNIKTKQLKKIVFNEDRPCNAQCEMATGESCSCSCGGANHGIAYKSR